LRWAGQFFSCAALTSGKVNFFARAMRALGKFYFLFSMAFAKQIKWIFLIAYGSR